MSKPFTGIFTSKKKMDSGKTVSLQRSCYAMVTNDGNTAEITMYGQIVKQRPTDWYGDPIDGDFIVLDEFLEDLNTVSDAKNIVIRLDSVGGDVYAALTIYNRLMELKAEITIKVDGVAMSAASMLMCAGDMVIVPTTSIIMIHTASLLLWGFYNSDELKKALSALDACDRTMAAAYRKKCGMEAEEILSMMQEETYMTGKEAVEKGFADKLIEGDDSQIAASADRGTLYVNGRTVRLPKGTTIPETMPIPTFTPAQADEINNNLPAPSGSEGGNKPMAKTIEELRVEYPELTKQLEAEAKAAAPAADPSAVETAVAAERARQKEIDEISAAINDDDLVREAKYGETSCSAQELAFRAMQKQAKQGEKHTKDVNDDYKASNAEKVGATATSSEVNPKAEVEAEVEATVDAGVKAVKEAIGGGK